MQIPKPLLPGATIAVIGVSGCVHDPNREALVRAGVHQLTDQGFRVRLDDTAFAQWGYLSGTDKQRAAAMNRAFADDTVDGVWCVKGGYGCIRLVDRIDWEMIAAHPKAFIGYSDITTLHTVLHERCHLCTFHGPMPKTDTLDGATWTSLLHAISGHPDRVVTNPDGEALTCFRAGSAEGQLVGGNLCLLATSVGTPYDLDVRGKLLFLEDVGEHVYTIDRYLQQLYHAGKLTSCAGIVLGRFSNITKEYEDSFTLDEVIRQMADRLPVPVLGNLQCGHIREKVTLCLGRRYRMDASAGALSLVD